LWGCHGHVAKRVLDVPIYDHSKDCVQDVLESICLEGERDGVCGGNCRLVLVLVLTAMIPEGRLDDMERLVSAGYPRSVLQLPRLGARWPKKGFWSDAEVEAPCTLIIPRILGVS
jgi:hypothetical protein